MRRLPLFPLPLVLFPGAVLPLHIFEPRYRQMMARCLEGDRRFGLVFHDPDRSGAFEMESGEVGCIAEILKFQPLPDGRSLVLTRGRDRFRIEDGIESPVAYYEGLVDEYPDFRGKPDELRERRRLSIDLFHQVVEQLDEKPDALPDISPARETSFALAQTIRIDPAWQQELLELRQESERLDRLDAILHAVLDETS
ncbi:MAG: LON peptidase substrate-binding domain-containing protein [Gemmatimonadota bacterium]|nr:LON peptidase substrate-binding domain-containing protein [Gemmatimonadota bacterium]